MSDTEPVDWSKQLFDDFVAAGITLFPYVPDAGNKQLIKYAEEHNGVRPILLTTEEEGVAVCAGADLKMVDYIYDETDETGVRFTVEDIPSDLTELADQYRESLLEAVSDFDDDFNAW